MVDYVGLIKRLRGDLKDLRWVDGSLDEDRVIELFCEVADALEYLTGPKMSEDWPEYVLAQVNTELRAEIERLNKELGRDLGVINYSELG